MGLVATGVGSIAVWVGVGRGPTAARGAAVVAVGVVADVVAILQVAGGEDLGDDVGVVQAGVHAIGHPEEQIGPDVIDGAGVPGAFDGLGQRVNAAAGCGDPVDGQVVPGQVRRSIGVAVPDHLALSDGLFAAALSPVRVEGDGEFLDLLDDLPGGQLGHPGKQLIAHRPRMLDVQLRGPARQHPRPRLIQHPGVHRGMHRGQPGHQIMRQPELGIRCPSRQHQRSTDLISGELIRRRPAKLLASGCPVPVARRVPSAGGGEFTAGRARRRAEPGGSRGTDPRPG